MTDRPSNTELREAIEDILNSPQVVMDGYKLDLVATQDKDIDKILANAAAKLTNPKDPQTELTMRECRKCHRVLPLDKLVTKASSLGGRQPFCKDCSNGELRERYAKNKDRVNRRVSDYFKSEAGKIVQHKYEENNQHKIQARKAVRNAVYAGRFEKTDCRQCSSTTTEFHHTEGYDEPNWFVGLWLCRPCHARLHRQLREASDG